MVSVVPSITGADSPDEYARLLELLQFASRLHIDLSDGEFAPSPTINPAQLYWPSDKQIDIHLMHQRPAEHTETLISLQPSLVTIHLEADDGPEFSKAEMLSELRKHGIKVGYALLADTELLTVKEQLSNIDHLLLFAGKLGFYGGQFNAANLERVRQVKEWAPELEIGWDGGANADNIAAIAKAGASAITVGGYLQQAEDAESAYATLKQILNNS